MSVGLTLAETKSRLEAACDAVVANQDRLTKADQAIGDGDHGVGMARGFKAAREALAAKPAATLADLFKAVGMAIMGKSGGASGAVFGTFFLGMAKGAAGDVLDAAGYAAALKEGLKAVQARGGAKPGDKTMIDGLVPAIAGAESGVDIGDALAKAAAGSVKGAEVTANMIATTGKAKALGERSRGHMDPGAITLSIVLGALSEPLKP
ncbi:MAG: dihydroxyacetone kinase subunit L [Rhizobiales bacterium]|nr:dihydroxyacetone kinase subunit L [Hyphomicrobiales bacterium]